MIDVDDKIMSQFKRGEMGSNLECKYYPCHYYGQNCTHCFCPFYPCEDNELGKYIIGRSGKWVWSCQDCYWIHRDDVSEECLRRFKGKDWSSMSIEQRLDIKKEIEKKHFKRAKPIMVLGATSGAGKSLMVTAMCRLFSNMGYTVTPYKSQNMSLNSFVTEYGEEIARIQDLQARAARKVARSHMNPILLKPIKDDISQVIIYGVPYKDMDVKTYYDEFLPERGDEILVSSLDFLKKTNDIIVMEGAGSPAEINLSEYEIANLRAAEKADAPCILVVNIERGGAFAYLYGTIMILEESKRKRFKGAIINNMRGDATSLEKGIGDIEEMTGIPVLGVVPHIDLELPSEDSMDIKDGELGSRYIIGVLRLPRISNFTDFDALSLMDGVGVKYISDPKEVLDVNILILPGTKSTIEDMIWLRENGFEKALKQAHGKIPIIGICGGFQMLGKTIIDVNSVESNIDSIEGLGFLNCTTYFDRFEKKTIQVEGHLNTDPLKRNIRGYEIHMGRTENETDPPLNRVRANGKNSDDGAYDPDMMVYGTYIHGYFDLPPARELLLSLIGEQERLKDDRIDNKQMDQVIEENLEKLTKVLEGSIDIESLKRIVGV